MPRTESISYNMNIRVTIPLITIVVTVITKVDSFFSERFVSSTIRDACNNEIRDSRTHQSIHSDKTFYLLSDNHANSVITGNLKYDIHLSVSKSFSNTYNHTNLTRLFKLS